MAGLLAVRQAGAEGERGKALAGGRDIVLLALDGFHRHLGDLADIHLLVADGKDVARDDPALEHPLHRGQVELGGHVHDGKVFVIEAVVLVVVARLAFRRTHDLVEKGLPVPLTIHRDEGLQLQQARIDQPPGTAILEADALDHRLFQLAHRDPAAKVGHVGGGGIGVDRPADQRQGAGLRLGLLLGQIGGRGEGQGGRLADRDHVDVGAQELHEVHEVERVILDIELAFADRDVAGIVPVGHIDFAIGQKAGNGRAQQRGIVSRHRRHQEHAARFGRAAGGLEVDQVAEGLGDQRFHRDDMVAPVIAHHTADAPVRLGDHPGKAALGHLAPGRDHIEERMRCQAKGGVGGHRARSGTKPFVGVPRSLHQIVG